MKTLAVIAIAPVVGVAALLVCDGAGMVPADSNTRRNYAATVEKDFIENRVRDTIVSATGPENRLLMVDAPWINDATATALVNEGMAQKAARYGFDGMIFQNKALRLNYDVRSRAFNAERNAP
jgi:hypothetical protein